MIPLGSNIIRIKKVLDLHILGCSLVYIKLIILLLLLFAFVEIQFYSFNLNMGRTLHPLSSGGDYL